MLVMEVPNLGDNGLAQREEIIEERSSPSRFNNIIGSIEDIMVSPGFLALQRSLLERFCEQFDGSTEENNLIHMELFQEYNQSIESFIMQELAKQVEDFSLESFAEELKSYSDPLNEEILEMICSITDFEAFRDMVLEHKKSFLVDDPFDSGLIINKMTLNN
ncbi:hypothetical protein TCAL_04963 [Tigriopus californicus]|uniref:ADP-ribosylation factor-like protein 2-binding protein n=1 Tax=Tigriopus californicus TaxID=6832 RepID=A0A553PBA3_TIGCA|nr:ADP-ribosylation factor-like protein 2-binding protein [Tigriopus californicus]TRY74965.1 hypothetical protein TCAL_04963 [Tigriopus californicus]